MEDISIEYILYFIFLYFYWAPRLISVIDLKINGQKIFFHQVHWITIMFAHYSLMNEVLFAFL